MPRRTPALGEELRALRERRGLSARDVAAMTGLSPSAITAVERGDRYPALDTLESLCACLAITVVIGPRETIIEPVA